jgi:cytochrome P450
LPNPFDGESTITSSDIDGLTYLNAVCNEVLRLYPPIALTVREAVRDTTILDQMIPKGTSIIIAPWAPNASKALWGLNAADFDPSRWIGTGKANTGSAESNYSFLTFLHGPRSCIGQAFAKAELACLLAVWIGTFEAALSDPDFVPEIRGGISAKPRGGLDVIFKRVDWQ